MKGRLFRSAFVLLLTGLSITAQMYPPPGGGGPGPDGPHGPPPGVGDFHRPPMPRAKIGPPGRWWMDPGLVQRLSLTTDQLRRIDSIFQQRRAHLLETTSALQREEAQLQPLLAADRPDENRVLAQIDRIAQNRAELEKTNARMLLSFRSVLTQDQWKRLQAETNRPPNDFHR